MPHNQTGIDPDNMLQLSNSLIKIEMVINRLDHDKISILGTGDPIVSDQDLLRLNRLGCEVSVLKKEFLDKTTRLNKMKLAYYQMLSRKHSCRIRLK